MKRRSLEAFTNFQVSDRDAEAMWDPRIKARMEWQILNYPVMFLPSQDEPAAICGILHEYGVGEIWMITGKNFKRHAPMIVNQGRSLCDTAIKTFKLHRLQLAVDSNLPGGRLFAERMGFVYEATLRRSGLRGENQDYYFWPTKEDLNG